MCKPLFAGTIVVTLLLHPQLSVGETLFFDDFSDGSLTNDLPIASDGTPRQMDNRFSRQFMTCRRAIL